MSNPFEALGIPETATAEEVRHAYHLLAKRCHPDHFQDEEQQKKAHEQMIALNRAYEEALRLATARANSPFTQQISCGDAIQLADKMMRQHKPESALRQLMCAATKDAAWFNKQGQILMAMEQYDSAHQSFREAVRRDPDNILYRRGALDAALALRESQSLRGKIRHFLKSVRQSLR